MKKSKYSDIPSTIQVIANVFKNPSLLDNEKYTIIEEDFDNDFHKLLFGTIYKLHEKGAEKISIDDIENFLSSREIEYGIYKSNKGREYLSKIIEMAEPDNHEVYYDRMKKISLLRAFDNFGLDVSFIYDPNNITDLQKKQRQEDYLNNATLADIINKIEDKIDEIRINYSTNTISESHKAGDGLESLIERMRQTPDVGIPLYGNLINTVTRGARLKKFYLRSAPTGIGKSRTMIADACYAACNLIYDATLNCWINNGAKEKVLYISTELDIEEVQTMMLAFVSNVDEEKIINGSYSDEEYLRIKKAVNILKNSNLFIEIIPDFSLKDIENLVKTNIREHDVSYVFFDYIHSSLKILAEVSKITNGMKLREDNILFMLSAKLKDICNQYGIFLMSSTQLSNDYKDSDTPDQSLLRGSKAIADKIDVGAHLLPVTEKDLSSLETVLSSNIFDKPDLKLAIYKNRRAKYKGVYLWCKSDLGVCKVNPMFATDYRYELLSMQDLKIIVEKENELE